jgi:biopolymer transport protein ExbD
MRIRDEQAEEEPSMNMTPMIDMVFQLLIFFMIATTYLDPERQIDVELPPAESGTKDTKPPDELVINVLQDGSVHLGERIVDEAALDAALAQAALHDKETPVTIRGDRLTAHEHIVRVMDACGVAGLSSLAVGTIEKN